jgi:hypothetical protein
MNAIADFPPDRRRRGIGPAARTLTPAGLALIYPAFVDGFHWAVGKPGVAHSAGGLLFATLMLLMMFAVPALGFVHVLKRHPSPISRRYAVRARRLAYAAVAAPTLYCFVGVWNILLSSPLSDGMTWVLLWCLLIGWSLLARPRRAIADWVAPAPSLRVAHGVSALILLAYVAFHLTNHLFAWRGEAAHAAVMEAGRTIYRSPVVEPLLVLAMSFQVVTGLILAWRWSARRLDFHRSFQVASGFFLAVYILGHMNSVFTLARWFFGIPTGWDFATGAPNGLIHDPWSVRLIPHYALCVFFVVAHLFSGLRVILLAHGAAPRSADRIWKAGTAFAALLSAAIMLAMCGMRIG